MFDTAKHYKSRGGDKVTIHEIVYKNSLGRTVTFPVKYSVRTDKPRARSRFQIATMDGRAFLLNEHKDDIVGLWSAT